MYRKKISKKSYPSYARKSATFKPRAPRKPFVGGARNYELKCIDYFIGRQTVGQSIAQHFGGNNAQIDAATGDITTPATKANPYDLTSLTANAQNGNLNMYLVRYNPFLIWVNQVGLGTASNQRIGKQIATERIEVQLSIKLADYPDPNNPAYGTNNIVPCPLTEVGAYSALPGLIMLVWDKNPNNAYPEMVKLFNYRNTVNLTNGALIPDDDAQPSGIPSMQRLPTTMSEDRFTYLIHEPFALSGSGKRCHIVRKSIRFNKPVVSLYNQTNWYTLVQTTTGNDVIPITTGGLFLAISADTDTPFVCYAEGVIRSYYRDS